MASNRTLLFCTSYSKTAQMWAFRHRRWLEHIDVSKIHYDNLAIFDDSSPVLPDWSDFTITNNSDGVLKSTKSIISFERRLGRKSTFDCEGWYRSFSAAVQLAYKQDFSRLLHIESDAFLVSERAVDWVNSNSADWSTLWSAGHNFPEMAIQTMNRTGIETAYSLFKQDYEWLRGEIHEKKLPFSNVNKDLIGERYHDFHQSPPRNIDWIGQAVDLNGPTNSWWLRCSGLSHYNLESARRFAGLLSGWSHCEGQVERFVWSDGDESVISLKLPETRGNVYLYLDLDGIRVGSYVSGSEIDIYVNSRKITSLVICSRSQYYIGLPSEALIAASEALVTIVHKNATRPCDISGSADPRKLSIKVFEARMLIVG